MLYAISIGIVIIIVTEEVKIEVEYNVGLVLWRTDHVLDASLNLNVGFEYSGVHQLLSQVKEVWIQFFIFFLNNNEKSHVFLLLSSPSVVSV